MHTNAAESSVDITDVQLRYQIEDIPSIKSLNNHSSSNHFCKAESHYVILYLTLKFHVSQHLTSLQIHKHFAAQTYS